jgi:hypothetical protein
MPTSKSKSARADGVSEVDDDANCWSLLPASFEADDDDDAMVSMRRPTMVCGIVLSPAELNVAAECQVGDVRRRSMREQGVLFCF